MKKAWTDKEKIRQQRIDESRAELLDLLLNKENKSADELERDLNVIKREKQRPEC